jgi:uncharacterized membrane protein YbhN (UPF0104 family)
MLAHLESRSADHHFDDARVEHVEEEAEHVVSPRRSRARTLISAFVSFVFLGAAAWWASKQEVPKLPSGTHAFANLAGALGVYAVATVGRGERWHRLLRQGHTHLRRRDSWSLTMVGYMGNNVLPARAGEALRTYLAAQRGGASKREVLGTIVAERVLDAVVLAIAFALGAYGTLIAGNPFVMAGLVVLGTAAILFFPSHWTPDVSHPRLVWLFETLKRLLRPTRRLASREGFQLLGLTFLIWALEATVYWMTAEAAGLGITWNEAVFVMVVANFVSLIPAGPGYVGTFDAAVLFAAKALGTVSSQRVAYLLVLRFVLFIPITIVGAVLLIARYGGVAGYRAARLQASEA